MLPNPRILSGRPQEEAVSSTDRCEKDTTPKQRKAPLQLYSPLYTSALGASTYEHTKPGLCP